ncbi:heavy-metal-associated domain-containing protein [Flavobacterium eburneipallidum]|uniref:heavy-metal-associated domain-containing protein n=1 Tax=Flavobacterium eburneipallidum TaxID=3003263 RepID=UPI002482FB1B|nr:heavy metal-associated domain-containing protein [Flavobacterium eburneipallidum]
MNFSKSIVSVALASLLFVGCKDKTTDPVSETDTSVPKVKKEITAANLQTATFSIDGMTCAIGCAKTIEKELSGLEGIQNATIDFEKKSAVVSFDKSILKSETITKVVENTGDGKTYKVSNMKL